MSKLLIAVAFAAALSTSALAVPSHVQSRSEPPHWQSQARNGQTNDPYWKPCHFSRYGGMNTGTSIQPAIKEVTMNKVLLALSMLTALSTPALASCSKAQDDSANAAFTGSKGGVEAFFNER